MDYKVAMAYISGQKNHDHTDNLKTFQADFLLDNKKYLASIFVCPNHNTLMLRNSSGNIGYVQFSNLEDDIDFGDKKRVSICDRVSNKNMIYNFNYSNDNYVGLFVEPRLRKQKSGYGALLVDMAINYLGAENNKLNLIKGTNKDFELSFYVTVPDLINKFYKKIGLEIRDVDEMDVILVDKKWDLFYNSKYHNSLEIFKGLKDKD